MPLWRRLVKREDILRDIQSCDEALGDALFVFNVGAMSREITIALTHRHTEQHTSSIPEVLARATTEL